MGTRALALAIVAVVGVALVAQPAEAKRGRHFNGSSYSANGTFGAGIELGAPTGLNAKYFLTPTSALNFGVGGDGYAYGHRDGLNFYLDYLLHPVSLANTAAFQLPLYVGIGGRIWDFREHSKDYDDDGFAVGVRVPVGIDLDLNNAPIDFFLQLTFVVDFYSGYRDNVGTGIDGSFGIRFWFN